MKTISSILISLFFISFIIPGQDWVIIKSKEEGYQISFPKKPEVEKQTVDSEVGELKMNMLMYEVDSKTKDDNLVYLFNYTDYPEGKLDYTDPEMVESILEGAVNGGAKNVGGKLLSNKDIKYKEYSGKEARIDFKDGMAVITMRCYLVKNRIYLQEVIALTEKDNNANENKFLDSFELIEKEE